MHTARKTKLAVWKLTSCDGCQLQLLNLEDRFLNLAEQFTFAYFPEGFREVIGGRYDISLVEGSVATSHDAVRLQQVRRRSRIVIAMGACATAGGIQALRNFDDVRRWLGMIYPRPEQIDTLEHSTPLSHHIQVEAELRGCPVNRSQLMRMLLDYRRGRASRVATTCLCMECKRLGLVCVTVVGKIPCLGPVTQAGCGAVCPAHGRGCYGCFGPSDTPNTAALRCLWHDRLALTPEEIRRVFRGVNAWSEAFRRESERL